jgi:hypothetical protein
VSGAKIRRERIAALRSCSLWCRTSKPTTTASVAARANEGKNTLLGGCRRGYNGCDDAVDRAEHRCREEMGDAPKIATKPICQPYRERIEQMADSAGS